MQQPKLIKIARLVLKTDGFIYADGVRIGRYIRARDTIQFVDKDRRRSSARGSRYVEVPAADLSNLQREDGNGATDRPGEDG